MKYIDEMTQREREDAYAAGKEVDRNPISLSMDETFTNYFGITLTDYYFNTDKLVEVEERLIEEFNIDNTGVHIGLRGIGEALGTKLEYPPDKISYIVDPVLKDYSMLDHMEVCDMHKDGTMPQVLEAAKILMDKYGKERYISVGISGPLSTAVSIRGTENILKDTVKNRENLHRLLDFSCDCIVECAKTLWNEAGVTVGFCEPIGAADLLSLKQCEEFLVPYMYNVNERIKNIVGSTPGFHMCGHSRDRWEVLKATGIGSFSVDNCESLTEAKKVMGDTLPIAGNIPPVGTLYAGTPEEIEKEVIRCLKEGSDSPAGYTICGGCQAPIGTPVENVHAYLRAARKYGRGAQRGHLCQGLRDVM
jgi:uroporphyrinogen decarboxylase